MARPALADRPDSGLLTLLSWARDLNEAGERAFYYAPVPQGSTYEPGIPNVEIVDGGLPGRIMWEHSLTYISDRFHQLFNPYSGYLPVDALSAFYAVIPVAHVEAGLRSNDPAQPFPEEMNRRLIDQIARLRFAPTEAALETLKSEQLGQGSFNVGNTVVDAMRILHPTISDHAVRLPPDPIVLVTAHRRESFGAPMESICRGILRIVKETPAHVMLPVHPNPGASEPIERLLSGHPQIHLMPPLPYGQLLYILNNARLVLTDSGGIQEEAPTFGVPLLVLRDVTERPEGIEAGVALLVGTDEAAISGKAVEILTDPLVHQSMQTRTSPYGDGHAAERIATIILAADHFLRRQETEVA